MTSRAPRAFAIAQAYRPSSPSPCTTTASPMAIAAFSVTQITVATPQLTGVASSSVSSAGRFRIHERGRM